MFCILLDFSNLRLAEIYQHLFPPCPLHILVMTYEFLANSGVTARIVIFTNVCLLEQVKQGYVLKIWEPNVTYVGEADTDDDASIGVETRTSWSIHATM